MTNLRLLRVSAGAMALLAAAVLSSGCSAPLVFGGLAAGGMVVHTDRRTAGTQLEDRTIDLKVTARANALLAGYGHLNVTSFNRVVLLTGEVPSVADRVAVAEAAAGVEQVRSVINEVAVMTSSSLTERSQDTLLTTKVVATLVDAGDVDSAAFKVVSERGVVYLMGLVTAREAERAVSLVRTSRGCAAWCRRPKPSAKTI